MIWGLGGVFGGRVWSFLGVQVEPGGYAGGGNGVVAGSRGFESLG